MLTRRDTRARIIRSQPSEITHGRSQHQYHSVGHAPLPYISLATLGNFAFPETNIDLCTIHTKINSKPKQNKKKNQKISHIVVGILLSTEVVAKWRGGVRNWVSKHLKKERKNGKEKKIFV